MSDERGVPFAVAPVRSDDPERKDKDKDKKGDDEEQTTTANGVSDDAKAGKDKDKDKDKEEEELSEEDQQLKSELEMLVERLKENDTSLYQPALESLRTLIRTATASMTSVPKPLKFLRPHYPEMQELYERWPADVAAGKGLFADILSVLAMTYSDTGKRETLMYRMKGGSDEDPGTWGHEYVRHLAAEIEEDYAGRTDTPPSSKFTPSELHALALQLVPFLLSHNGEADAVDLLLELESISSIVDHVDENTYSRVCLYMTSCVNLLVPPDDREFLRTARTIYRKFERYSQAIVCSLRLGDQGLIREDFQSPKNASFKRQLAYILARQQFHGADEDVADDETLLEILSNTKLSEHFQAFGKELSLVEPRSLEDIYKSHLENTRVGSSMTNIDSAKQNLAGTFVNAYVNAGFGNDKLMAQAEEGQSWIYKNKDHGMLSAAASLGLSFLWNPESGLDAIDKYTYVPEEYIKAGAMLANGIVHSGIKTEADAAFALLEEHVDSNSVPIRVSAIMGIGIAYAGTQRQDILDKLLPIASNTDVSMEIASMAALALGFIFVGSADGDITGALLQTMMEREDKHLDEKWGRFLALALALLYLGQQDASDATLETLKAIEHPLSKTAQILVDVCSFAGTGNVLKIQSMLHHCTDHIDAEKDSDLHQSFATLGIALIAMGEDVGAEMSLRQFDHLMHYGEPVIRRAVPLAYGILSASNPQLHILDTLSKYSHDNDLDVALNAIFAMGIVGSGTNNARLAQMLRQLASYYYKEPDCLFMVRFAQGLVHMGKGMIGINPFHTDRNLMSPIAVAGLLSTITAFTDAKAFILEKSHWMLYFLVMGMYPRFLITFDEEGNTLPVTVRVGQAVDTVGQAGKPRTISGFQTHSTPVRLGHTERAELATEEFIPYTHVLEGFAILAKNKGFERDEMDTKP